MFDLRKIIKIGSGKKFRSGSLNTIRAMIIINNTCLAILNTSKARIIPGKYFTYISVVLQNQLLNPSGNAGEKNSVCVLYTVCPGISDPT